MATIVQKFNKYYVTYSLPREVSQEFYEKNGLTKPANDKNKQVWEPFPSREAAEERKRTVEIQIAEIKQFHGAVNHLTVMQPIRLGEYVERFFIPAKAAKWQPKTYTMNVGLLQNHVLPHLGDKLIQSITAEDINRLFEKLKRTPKGAYKEGVCVMTPEELAQSRPRSECLGPTTIHDVAIQLGSVFRMAQRKKVISDNPMPEELPHIKTEERVEVWDNKLMTKALQEMRDMPLLRLAVHLSYVGALRNGEAVGITLEELDLSHNRIHITKILQRVEKKALEQAKADDVLFRFPTVEADKDTCLILKRPKNDSSVRELLVSDQLKAEVEARVAEVKRNRKALGEKYHDYGLLLCLHNGNPIEPTLMMRWFRLWQKRQQDEKGEEYPKLVFHGIRHSSATYYVENCDGDFKSVQAITGHSSLDVLLKIYAHATTPARQRLLDTFQTKFYGGKPADNLTSAFTAPQGREEEAVGALVGLARESSEIKDLLLTICKENPNLQQTILTALLAG